MKRLISLFLCFVLITGVLSSCGQSKGNDSSNGSGIKVMLTLSQADTFRNTLVEAAKKAAKEYMKLYPNDTGMQKELRFITLK